MPQSSQLTSVTYRRDDCRLCGSRDLELVLPLTPAPIVDAYVPESRLGEIQESYNLDVYLCAGCGHAQLLDVVDPEVLYVDYIYETTSSMGLVDHFEKYAADVINRRNLPKDSQVVDIGSNDGTLLSFFQKQGMRVLGVDPAREIAMQATQSGIETLPVFFTLELAAQLRKERGPASVITVNNLFANVDDLADLTHGIHELLAPDGVFLFESFYLSDLMKNMVFDFIYHEHLNCFSVKPLQSFFPRFGLELIDVQRVPTKGGSLRATVQLAGGPRQLAPSVAKLIREEASLGVQSVEKFKEFSGRIDAAKNQVSGLLAELKEKGMSVAGYGASASSTPLIHHFNMYESLAYLLDDNPAKQNLFSPGLHIPVFPSEAIYQRKPDYIVLLAWRFREPIIKKHQAYLDQGGHFIVPLPSLEVV